MTRRSFDLDLLCDQEFAEKLMANMGGGNISGRKWVILGSQVKVNVSSSRTVYWPNQNDEKAIVNSLIDHS